MVRRVLPLCFMLCLIGTTARADIIDPVIGVRGDIGGSTPLSQAIGASLGAEDCDIEGLEEALCWFLENDLGFAVTDIRGFFSNPACDVEQGSEDVDCILSLDEGSDFPTLETLGDAGFGLQEFRFSGNSIPSEFIIELAGLNYYNGNGWLTTPFFAIYGFEFAPGTTLTLTGVNTIAEPGTLLLLGSGMLAVAIRRRRRK